MESSPLISVIIPTFNRLEYLSEALTSVLEQTHQNLEVLVVDDGSDDGTGDYVRSLGADRITYLPIAHQGRPAPARNVGLKTASGEFVAFLDSDDAWLPNKIAAQLQAFEQEPELAMVATDFFVVPAPRPRTGLGLGAPKRVSFRDLMYANSIQNSSVMIRSEVVAAVGLLDESPEVRGLEDYEYWLRVLRSQDHSAIILPEPLVRYRRHTGNIGVQDVDQIDRLRLIVERHRAYDEGLVESVVEELHRRKAFRSILHDVRTGNAGFGSVLVRRGIRPADRLRLIRHRARFILGSR